MKSHRERALELEKIVEEQIQSFGTEEDIVLEDMEDYTNQDLYELIKGVDSVTSNMRKIKKGIGERTIWQPL